MSLAPAHKKEHRKKPVKLSPYLTKSPWDAAALGIESFEIHSTAEKVLWKILKKPGHYTLKVDPFSSKKNLHKFGFYYCDTLVVPYCDARHFTFFENKAVSVSSKVYLTDLIRISQGVFYGRFHRDFNIHKEHAELRYTNWLKELHRGGNILALLYEKKLAGFFAFYKNKIKLHALAEHYRGRGLAKYLWSAACRELFNRGHSMLESSISAANMPVLNLYCSLGFRFKNPLDVYHRLVVESPSYALPSSFTGK